MEGVSLAPRPGLDSGRDGGVAVDRTSARQFDVHFRVGSRWSAPRSGRRCPVHGRQSAGIAFAADTYRYPNRASGVSVGVRRKGNTSALTTVNRTAATRARRRPTTAHPEMDVELASRSPINSDATVTPRIQARPRSQRNAFHLPLTRAIFRSNSSCGAIQCLLL